MATTESACFDLLEPSRGQIQTGTTALSYLEWNNSGPPIVLLHGITSSARTWWRVAPRLAERGYHIYAFDMPGHGQSAAVETHRIEQIAALINNAIDALALDRPTVIGHSWGGATALALAGERALTRLVLVDPLLALSSASSALRLPTFLQGLGMPPEQTLPGLRAANPDWHDCDFFWKAEALQQCRPAAVRGLFTASGDWSLTADLARVDVPLLLLLADPQYTVIPPETQAAAQRALRPGLGEMIPVPGTNHNMFRGGFEPFIQVLLPWLNRP